MMVIESPCGTCLSSSTAVDLARERADLPPDSAAMLKLSSITKNRAALPWAARISASALLDSVGRATAKNRAATASTRHAKSSHCSS